jgi:hypothetical protein
MKRSLLTIIALLAAADALAADPQITLARNEAPQVISFDNWEIRKGLVEHSYMLIGQSRAREGQFWLNCDSNGLVNVAVPLVERNGRDRLRSFPVTVWSDEHKRQEVSLVVFENFVAIAIDYEGAKNDKLETFLGALQTAKRTFAISYDDRIFEFDVAALPAARARFAQLCGPRPIRTSARAAQ